MMEKLAKLVVCVSRETQSLRCARHSGSGLGPGGVVQLGRRGPLKGRQLHTDFLESIGFCIPAGGLHDSK